MFSRDKKARERIEELERRFEELTHKFKILALEWEEAYEKINVSLRKLGRRAEVLQKEMDAGKPALSAEEEALRANMSDFESGVDGLTPRQAALQSRILARRRKTGMTQ